MKQFIALIVFVWGISAVAGPPNDYFTNRIVLPSTNYIITSGSNVDATVEQIETNKVTTPAGKSVWWQWRAPYSGRFLITTDGSDFDTVLVLYTDAIMGGIIKLQEDDNGVTPDFVTSYASLISYAAVSNTVYYIAVYGKGKTNTASGNIVLRILPDNDMFADRIPLTGARVTSVSYNGKATVEDNETYMICCNSPTAKTLWWSWTAPYDGSFIISTIGSSFNTILAVYTNIANPPALGSSMKLVKYDNDSGHPVDLTSVLSITAKSNQTFYIVVDGYQEDEFVWAGQVALNIRPDNDKWTNRTRLYGLQATDESANGHAASETGENNLLNAAVSSAQQLYLRNTVWWEWQAPASGMLVVDTYGSDFDTILAIYTGDSPLFYGTGSNIKLIAWDDNSGPPEAAFTDVCTVGALPLETYKIQVQGNGYDGYGRVVINVKFYPGPTNDMFTNRIMLPSVTQIQTNGSNVYASAENGEPLHAGLTRGKSVWWSWTAPISGQVRISTAGSDFDTVLAVYTGSSVTSLVSVASNNDDQELGGVLTSLVVFNASAGTTYHIAVDGMSTDSDYKNIDSGNIILSIEQIGAPANDNFSDRITLSGHLITITALNTYATKEPGEPNHADDPGGASLWWSWRPPFSGIATITTDGSNFDTTLAIYTGTSISNLVKIIDNNDRDFIGGDFSSAVTFYALSNMTYQIAVDGFQGATGLIKLNINLTNPVKLSPALNVTNNSFKLKFSALPGHSYELQSSEDLILWVPVTVLTATGSELEYIEQTILQYGMRFYRIVEYP